MISFLLPFRRALATATVLLACLGSLLASANVNSDAAVMGEWINPHGSVRVRTEDCGGKLCGHVVWASSEAIADARDSGTANLIGTQLLSDYRLLPSGRWSGRVFVPDMGRSFSSTIVPLGGTALQISGCILGGLICKSQVWKRG
jgi:uncharacterized protein (DUF2147 family)